VSAIETARLLLREPTADDATLLADYYRRNAARFEQWEPARPAGPEAQRRWIAEVRAQRAAGAGATFLALDRALADAQLAGVVALSGFSVDPPGAMLDYSVDAAYEGRGFASEAVAALLDYGERELGRYTIGAYYDPGNARSAALLQRLGFRVAYQTPPIPNVMRAQVCALRERAPRAG
jgi:[ribosomal protein S5]-alanine N-acetyltransferase